MLRSVFIAGLLCVSGGCGAKPEPSSGGVPFGLSAQSSPEEQQQVVSYLKSIHQATGRFNESGEVDALNLADALLTDFGLSPLEELTALRSLTLLNTRITDKGLVRLKKMTRLVRLDLSQNVITDDGLVHLMHLGELQVLNLSGTRVTDRGLAKLAKLPNLQFLNVVNTGVTEGGMLHFTRNPTGRRCDISY